MACPACAAVPLAEWQAAPPDARIILSLPHAHCAACMTTVESALMAVPGVQSARLNLTQKRAHITANPDVTVPDLIAALAAAGYEAHELDGLLLGTTETDRQGRELLIRLGISFFAMMNIMLLSVAVWSGASDATRDMFHWISAAIALPTVFYCGQPFFRSAAASLRAGRLGMDVPISLALILASGISLFETALSGHQAYFDAAVMLCFFLLGGRYLDHRTRALARSAAEELTALEVPRATVLRHDNMVVLPIAEVVVGDLLRVLPGARVPADGIVTDGASELDRSLLTGESAPVSIRPGDTISAGEVNLTGPLTLRVTAAGRESSLHRMADLVAIAESAKGAMRSLADRAARAYSPLVHLLSFSAFGYWMWQTGGDLRYAVNISAAVLIITCPCALGLAVPAVVTAASGALFRMGLLVKSGTALERLAEVDTVVFDKTGTLTLGQPDLADLGQYPPAALAVALALASSTSHPLAQALATALRAAGVAPARVTGISEVPGSGVTGLWQGQTVRLGRAEWCGAVAGEQTATYLQMPGKTHTFAFSDHLRPGAMPLVQTLLQRGLGVMILSGDTPRAV
ncbi:MAG: heavy metal translocating P-type ATPase, partial [Paracoccaceae bacterium]